MTPRLAITGWGAVSPAGWGAEALVSAVRAGQPLPAEEMVRAPGAPTPLVRRVPKPAAPHSFSRDPRMRRTSPIATFAVASALEALGPERVAGIKDGTLRVGVIFSVFNGCVNFSRRFFSEVLADPRTASPLIFPETVFNAPASHLSSVLGSREVNYTLVGDSAQFLASLHTGADWLLAGGLDGVLVVTSEEIDWMSAEACALTDRLLVVSEGAAAVYLEPVETGGVTLAALPAPVRFTPRLPRAAAAAKLRSLLPAVPGAVLCDGLAGAAKSDRIESAAWADFTGPRFSARAILGEGLAAGAGWQCVLAAALVASGAAPAAVVSALGGNEHATGCVLGADAPAADDVAACERAAREGFALLDAAEALDRD